MKDYVTLHIDDYDVLIDACDIGLISGKAWYVDSPRNKPYLKWSTRKNGKGQTVFFHRLILQPKIGEIVDHINGNSLDNRRENLRIVDWTKNAWNSANPRNSKSKFKGVGWSNDSWQVSIRNGERQIYIGRFKNEIEAAYNYDLASLKYHGEFGRRNFLPLVVE